MKHRVPIPINTAPLKTQVEFWRMNFVPNATPTFAKNGRIAWLFRVFWPKPRCCRRPKGAARNNRRVSRGAYACLLFLLLFDCFSCNSSITPTISKLQPGPPPPPTADQVFYEVNFNAFGPNGSLANVQLRLPQIKALGCNIVWLMPVFPKGQLKAVGSPYCIRDYQAVNPSLGTLDDLISLVNAAHSIGMSVILDWAANHTAWDHAWINQHPEWYTHDGNGNIIIPPTTNWTDVAELEYSNPDMRRSMISAMQYWIDTAGIDGFRCDAADFVPDDFWAQAIASLQSNSNHQLILLAEGSRYAQYDAGFQLEYGWNYYDQLIRVFGNQIVAGSLVSTHLAEYASLSNGQHRLRYTTNHDKAAWDGSAISLLGGKAGSLAAFAATAALGGVPLVYSGQEAGRSSTQSFFNYDPVNWSENPDVYTAIQAILACRAANNALRSGTLTDYSQGPILAFQRTSPDQKVLVLVNTASSPQNWTCPVILAASNLAPLLPAGSVLPAPGSIPLGAYEYRIYLLQ